MKLIYGTHNPSKLTGMIKAVSGLPLEIVDIKDIDLEIHEAEESGNEPLENAIQKSQAYYKQIKKPVFSCDSGLYFEGVSDEDQPGVHARRVDGKRLNDDEMRAYYQTLAKKYGGKLTAYYKNAICLTLDHETMISYDGETIHSEKFYIIERAHKKRVQGFPLDSLSVEIDSGQYYFDIDDEQLKIDKISGGFRDFFIKSMNLKV
ncbi:non-canonical purine NTP pyrophosphatase [Fusibacter bizertensis]|uniref:Non-canonical purine NTP pyrophosphatase n=1 Tax=Fusibacter bizertensis TaxID=1488331 RepID=A0ABT6N8L8_9FIRM|nr:non-canonical purine NTP pyrophosphatase [Fusibacter bizertensis]MDH8676776.1 non-canonical purine NTP pyrophosphatase [Fusibacter bizertensis]